MIRGLLRLLDSWTTVVVATVLAHLAFIQVKLIAEPRDPKEFVDFQLIKRIEPEPEPEPEEEPEPEPEDEPEPEPEPPPPEPDDITLANETEEPEKPPKYVTGIPLTSGSLFDGGMAVRVGNTYRPGFDDDVDLEDLSGVAAPPPPRVRPKLLRAFEPPYPEEMVNTGVEGNVTVRVLVGSNGRAKDVMLVEGVHPVLDSLAVQSVKRFRWKAGEMNNHFIEEWVRVTFVFTIDKHERPARSAETPPAEG